MPVRVLAPLGRTKRHLFVLFLVASGVQNG
jgi:hypothetical protein